MSDDLAKSLRAATGAPDSFCISVADADHSPVQHEFVYPYVVIGRGEGSDILLTDHQVSYRHAYFQIIEGRVFCVDLASRNGVLWPDGPRKYGWVVPDTPIRIGPYALRVVGDEARDLALQESLGDLNPLERYRGQAGPMPKVDLEFRFDSGGQPTWSVNRLLTLAGRSPLCKLRSENPLISAVHCALLLTRSGLWAVDLLGRGGTKVDGEDIRAVPLESGAELTIGNDQIGVFYEPAPDVGAIDRLTDNAADSETSMDDLESPFLQDAPVPDTTLAPPVKASPEPAPLDWLGTIFKIEADGPTLVVLPVVDGCGFRYQHLHVEANALQRKFEMKLFANIIVDLRNLNYFGSELIGVLIRLARTVTDGKGKAAFCSASPRMLEVLQSMRLTKLWPIFATREEAVAHVKK
jgi:anti-anti-sigma factor